MFGTGGSPEARRYRPWIWTVAVVTGLSIVVAYSVLRAADLGAEGRLAVALAPVVLFAVLIVLEVRQMRHLDELQRRIQLEALGIAFPTAGVLAMGISFLQKAGYVTDWTLAEVWPWMFLLYFPAYGIARWRYR